MNARPSFADLSPEEQLHFGNGVGPYWLPAWARAFITGAASWFFQDASWRHHDFGYVVGGDRWDRARCDWKFFTNMLGDACSQPINLGRAADPNALRFIWAALVSVIRIPLALFISIFFYLAVRIFGQFGSFEYRKTYADLKTIRRAYLSNQRKTT